MRKKSRVRASGTSKKKTKTAKKKQTATGNKSATAAAKASRVPKKQWELRLYVAGHTEKSVFALANLRSLCERYLKGEYAIEVIDLIKNPQLAKGDQIIATPTLVKKLPTPVKRIIGDLSNTERVLVGLNLVRHG